MMITALPSPPGNSPLPRIGCHNAHEHLPTSSDLRRISAFTDHGPTFLVRRPSRRPSNEGPGTGGEAEPVTGGNRPA